MVIHIKLAQKQKKQASSPFSKHANRETKNLQTALGQKKRLGLSSPKTKQSLINEEPQCSVSWHCLFTLATKAHCYSNTLSQPGSEQCKLVWTAGKDPRPKNRAANTQQWLCSSSTSVGWGQPAVDTFSKSPRSAPAHKKARADKPETAFRTRFEGHNTHRATNTTLQPACTTHLSHTHNYGVDSQHHINDQAFVIDTSTGLRSMIRQFSNSLTRY